MGRDSRCDSVGFDAARTIAVGPEGLLQEEEAREVGVPRWLRRQMEGLVPPRRLARPRPLGIRRFPQTYRYVSGLVFFFW